MGIQANWKSFVNMTQAKADSHGAVAQYWDRVHNVLNMLMILFAAITTLSTLLPVSKYVPAAVGAVTTLLSAISGSLNPSQRRQEQMESSKGFRALMLRMVRVETERDFEELWKEYNKELLGEPFLPEKYKVKTETEFSMSPEFQLIVRQKIEDVEEAYHSDQSSEDDDGCTTSRRADGHAKSQKSINAMGSDAHIAEVEDRRHLLDPSYGEIEMNVMNNVEEKQ